MQKSIINYRRKEAHRANNRMRRFNSQRSLQKFSQVGLRETGELPLARFIRVLHYTMLKVAANTINRILLS